MVILVVRVASSVDGKFGRFAALSLRVAVLTIGVAMDVQG